MNRKNNSSCIAMRNVILSLAVVIVASCLTAYSKPVNSNTERFKLAAEYSRQHRGLSMLVVENNKVVFEDYQNGHSADQSHRLASGTKSFSGAILAAAIEDGLVTSFDEAVSETILEWKGDSLKARITLRQLLSLTSGIDAGNVGRPPTYSEAVKYPVRFSAGQKFQYGPAPFQIFGEVMRRKLANRNESVLDYLKRRILDPIGLKVSRWRMQDGQPNLPSGAFLTAREWAKFGQLLVNRGKWKNKQILKKRLLDELSKGSKANPNYGLTFWLNRSSDGNASIAEAKPSRSQRILSLLNIRPETDRISQDGFGKGIPKDIMVAAGAGKQRLYIIPFRNLVVVRQGRQSRFEDHKFMNRLLFGKK